MSLNAGFSLLLEQYGSESKKSFAGNTLAGFVRKELPGYLRDVLGKNDRYIVHGSAGQSNWAKIPWVAVFDRLVTESAKQGYYLVYLVREDCSGLYLSLLQGVTAVREQYGVDTKHALQVRAADFLAQLGARVGSWHTGQIDLRISQRSGLGADYEAASVCDTFYEAGKLPDDDAMAADLKAFVDLYLLLVSKEVAAESSRLDLDHDGTEYFEDRRHLVVHSRVERNSKLAKAAKKAHGCVCQACGFDFYEVYGEIGKGYIEAHHKTPVASRKGERLRLDPREDFGVLCANCHRMIHKSKFVGDIESFRSECLQATGGG